MSVAKAGSANRSSKFRGANDFYKTPPEATWALVKLGILPKLVWEPACGDGALARVLFAAGHEVVCSDLVDRGYGIAPFDFLKTDKLLAPAIVTNPPFSHANEFVCHSLDLGADLVAMFLSVKFLAGAKRYEMLHLHRPPAEMHVFIERVKFFSGDVAEADQPGWNTEDFAWFVWRRQHASQTTVGWLRRDGNSGVCG